MTHQNVLILNIPYDDAVSKASHKLIESPLYNFEVVGVKTHTVSTDASKIHREAYVTFYWILQESEQARLSEGETCYTVICTVYFCMKHFSEQNFLTSKLLNRVTQRGFT